MANEENINLADTLKAFERLKQDARSLEDVNSWFLANTALLEISPGVQVKEIVVSLSYGDLFDVFYEQDTEDVLRMRVVLRTVVPEVNQPAFMKSMSATYHTERTKADRWLFPIKMEEWSFIVANLAFTYLRDKQWQSGHQAVTKLESFLETQLPRHFPGMHIKHLRSLHETGLFPVDPPEAVTNVLYNTRSTSSSAKELPYDLVESITP